MSKSFEVTELPVRSTKFIPRKQWVVAGADDMYIRVVIKSKPMLSTLNLRIPIWTYSDGATAALNNKPLHVPSPGVLAVFLGGVLTLTLIVLTIFTSCRYYLSITRKWRNDDVISLTLQIRIRTEAIKGFCEGGSSTKRIHHDYFEDGWKDDFNVW